MIRPYRAEDLKTVIDIANRAWREIYDMFRGSYGDEFRAYGMLYAKVRTGLDEAHAPARRAYERVGFDIHHEDVAYDMKL